MSENLCLVNKATKNGNFDRFMRFNMFHSITKAIFLKKLEKESLVSSPVSQTYTYIDAPMYRKYIRDIFAYIY